MSLEHEKLMNKPGRIAQSLSRLDLVVLEGTWPLVTKPIFYSSFPKLSVDQELASVVSA